ncbi:molecular chaperone [Parelaphostrongylus tenuis]|uniref:Molecular chaperone n=1 Tax=Parelaphostrongylus tenuis TaxID=148309 RepID=A0AAD5QT34_PARTN|nr:molecular chaperone [Parelaphostrongylus tenuis]
MSWLQQEPMEPIPEEGADDMEWTYSPSSSTGRRTTMRKREIFTSEQIDTLVSTVPKDTVPSDWIIENEVVDPRMATSYMTESLVGPTSARGTSYTYTYETHYDNPPDIDDDEEGYSAVEDSSLHQTHKITRVTKVTTTRSLKQIPVESPYSDLYFDAEGLPTPSPIVEIGEPLNDSEMRLQKDVEDLSRPAPPPAPPLGSRYVSAIQECDVPSAPGAPDVIGTAAGEVTLTWGAPLQKPDDPSVLGYQKLRELPDGDWERAHDQLLRDTTCTITNLKDCVSEVQFRVSAAGPGGFGPPSLSSVPVHPVEQPEKSTISVPRSPGRPRVIAVDGHRATIEWTPPAVDPKSAPLAGYQIEYRVYGTAHWMVANDTMIPDCCYTVENLRPNGVYEFRVRGHNADGLGAPSRSSGATHIKPATPQRGAGSRVVVPSLRPAGQPQLVEADMDWVKLEWAESEPNAGYIVEFREIGDPNWYTANQHPITLNCIHVEGLRPGSTYEFRVICVVGDTASFPSEVSDVISLRPLWKSTSVRGVPARPQAPEYLEIDGERITICWLPALSTLPVLGYDVEFRDFQQDAGWYKVNDQPIHACKMTVGDLINGHEYQFRVLAHNVVGCSEPSDASPSVRIQANTFGNAKYIEAERFGSVKLLMEEMIRESPPLPERDDSPPPLHKAKGDSNLHWRDPSLKEVIDYLDNPDREKQLNASGYLQHLTYSDNLIKDETREYGGIPKLVHLLKSDMPIIQKNACACLKNLCFGKENDRNKLAVLDADGVRMLAAVLQTTNDAGVREEATAALWNLSSSDMLKPVIVEAATDALVQQVSSSTHGYRSNGVSNNIDPLEHYNSPAFKNATGVLRNISAANTAARKRLRVCPNLIEDLVHFLTVAIQRNQVDSQSVENVVCILRNLSYRIQEVEDPNYDPASAHLLYSKGSKVAPNSPKPRKDKDKRKEHGNEVVTGPALLWQPHVVKLYLKLLQEASNLDTLEASAGAVQNLAACQFAPSAEVRAAVRVEKGLPVLVELIRLKDDYVVCAVATALRNLSLDSRNLELIGKYALRDLIDKLPDSAVRRAPISDQTIGAVLGILFEVVRSSAAFTKDVHEARGTEKLRMLARSYPMYSHRVCKYASQVLFMMWQHKELHDGFKRSGLKEADFYSGTARGDSTTLARPISSQGKEKPALLDDTGSSGGGYGAVTDSQHRYPLHRQQIVPSAQNGQKRSDKSPHEPLYASVRKGDRIRDVNDSWV